jgi:hypothetical protein
VLEKYSEDPLIFTGFDKVWIVKIDDLTGKYMYWIYAYDRLDAEQFIDAISNFLKIDPK